jgi:hypothetical protein
LIDGAETRTPLPTAIWTSSAPATLKVSSDGLVTSRAKGDATIMASLGSIASTIVFRVEQEVTASRIALGGVPPLLKAKGASVSASATAADRSGNALMNRTIAWSVSDTTVAGIDQNGLMRTRKSGQEITVAPAGSVVAIWPFEVATRVRVPVDPFFTAPIH